MLIFDISVLTDLVFDITSTVEYANYFFRDR